MNAFCKKISYLFSLRFYEAKIVSNAFLKKLIPDELYIKMRFHLRMGYALNLKDPKTFNEKLQWLKLYYRLPIMTTLVDKYEAKKYVADIIGEEYIIPTLGVWERYEDIDFNSLPDKFVLKTTHDSKGVIICRDKSSLDMEFARKKINACLKKNFFWDGREWPYKNVHPRIIAEQLVESESSKLTDDLMDYKFYCFNGVPQYCQVIRDRTKKETIDFYDMEWNHMPFTGMKPNVCNGLSPVEKPNGLGNMIKISNELSKGFPFSRVDLYEVNSQVYFGEVTFFPASGYGFFKPENWNVVLGDLIDLKGVTGGVQNNC